MSYVGLHQEDVLEDEDEDSSDLPRTGTTEESRRAFWWRAFALLCACTLSVGSHYGSYILGPIKSRLTRELGTSNTEFSLLLAAYSLNSTWTPLVGGFLALRMGAALTAIGATSLIFSGQLILFLGEYFSSVRAMALGMFIFGLGTSPLAVAQETIVVRFFKDHGLGLSLALGLVAGKGASFLAARTSYPLSQYSPHAPFATATALAALSFTVNVVFILMSHCIERGAERGEPGPLSGAEVHSRRRSSQSHVIDEQTARKLVSKRRTVRIRDLASMGDVFWVFVLLNILCGAIWSPFAHLAANILEVRYDLSESEASQQASVLLAGSIVLYPICGYLSDNIKRGAIVHWLLLTASVMIMCSYIWLSIPPSVSHESLPGLVLWGLGHGFATLLLVLMVPKIVPSEYVATALGMHKSIEQCGSTMMQTLSGLYLDMSDDQAEPGVHMQRLLNTFLVLSVLQLASAVVLWRLDQNRKAQHLKPKEPADAQHLLRTGEESSVDIPCARIGDPGSGSGNIVGHPRYRRAGSWSTRTRPLLRQMFPRYSPSDTSRPLSIDHSAPLNVVEGARSERERRRGSVFTAMAFGVILATWALLITVAANKLHSRQTSQ